MLKGALEMRSVCGNSSGANSGYRSEFVRTAMLTQLLQSDSHRSETLGDTLHDTYGLSEKQRHHSSRRAGA